MSELAGLTTGQAHPVVEQALALQAMRADAGAPEGWLAYAEVLYKQGRFGQAYECLRQVLRLAPGHRRALVLMADTCLKLARESRGWDAMEQLAQLGPLSGAEALVRGLLASHLRRFDDAQAAYAAAQQAPEIADHVRHARSSLRLAAGDWAQGWSDAEARFASVGYDNLTCFDHQHALWRTQSLRGKTLLVHREQGYGDMIMYASMLDDLLAAGCRLVVAVPASLQRLFAASFPDAICVSSRVVAGDATAMAQDWLHDVPPIDLQIPFCSLGDRLRPDAAAFGTPRAYLRADPVAARHFALQLHRMRGRHEACLTVGLCASARLTAHAGAVDVDGVAKSVPLADLAALAPVAGVQWVNLLKPEAAQPAPLPDLDILDLSWAVRDHLDTASLIQGLDLVVTVDTGVAHLAAAMGKETWLLLKWAPDWRWDHEGRSSVWYPRVRLFRQTQPGDWPGVLRRVAAALQERVAQGAHGAEVPA